MLHNLKSSANKNDNSPSSKHAFDIEGLGNETVNALVEKGLINNFSDIFTLQETQLLKLDGFAGKSSSNLISL